MGKMELYSGSKKKLKNTGRKKSEGQNGPKFKEIDWEQVKRAAHIQCTCEEIAGLMNISHDTMERACQQEFGMTFTELREEWSAGGKCSLRRKQWQLADKSAAMAIFLGKQMLGQQDDYGVKYKGPTTQQIVQYGDKPIEPWKAKDESSDNQENDKEPRVEPKACDKDGA